VTGDTATMSEPIASPESYEVELYNDSGPPAVGRADPPNPSRQQQPLYCQQGVGVAATGVAVSHTTTTSAAAAAQVQMQGEDGGGDDFTVYSNEEEEIRHHGVGDDIDERERVASKLAQLLTLCQDVAELKEHYQKRKTTVETPVGSIARQQHQQQKKSNNNNNDNEEGGDNIVTSPLELAAWEKIRQWLKAHPSKQSRRAAVMDIRGEYNVTAIHVVCRHGHPPMDIFDQLLEAAGPEACQCPDTLEWLPLHYACGALAPTVVLDKIAQCYPPARAKQDKRGRTPLHFALGSAARQKEEAEESHHDKSQWHSIYDPEFIQQEEASREQTYQGLDATVMEILSGNGAPTRKDESGMLPLHYACAYLAVSEDALRILIEANPPSLVALDGHGRSPLHFTMGNSDKVAAPMVTNVLLTMSSVYQQSTGDPHAASALSLQSQLVNLADREGKLPIHLLAMSAKRSSLRGSSAGRSSAHSTMIGLAGGRPVAASSASIAQPWTRKESNKLIQQQQTAQKCLRLYLIAQPEPTAAFLTALQTLPSWLRDAAVISPHVQSFLNRKITQRFLTTTLMLDFYVLMVIIIFFRLTTTSCIAYRQCFDENNDVYPCENSSELYPGSNGTDYELYCGGVQLYFLYICATYFLLREIVQALSLQSLNLFQMWATDAKNWLSVVSFSAVYFLTATMQFGLFHQTNADWLLQVGAALTTGLLWGSLIAFLKSTLVDFAVFVQGVIFVVRKLGAFCMCVAVIITAFALMFNTEFQCSVFCTPSYIAAQSDDPDYYFPWCDLRESLLKCMVMMVGQVDETDFPTRISQAMYGAFGFLVTLLLFNVLIAIVIDSYSVIRNERAAIVFWSNRLDFVAEMDAILSGPWKWTKNNDDQQARIAAAARQEVHPLDWYWWKNVMQVFEDQELKKCSFEYLFYFMIRFIAAVIIVPLWLLIGLATAGMLWPPQIRDYLLVQKTTEKFKDDDALHGFYELSELKENMTSFKLKVKAQMKADRDEITSFGEAASGVKSSMMADLAQIKEVMQSMLEVRRAAGPRTNRGGGGGLRRRRTNSRNDATGSVPAAAPRPVSSNGAGAGYDI
jgi:ankyrin repeat protein